MASRELSLAPDETEDTDEFEIGADATRERKAPKFQLSEEDEDLENLVPLFQASEEGQAVLKKISRQVLEDFDTAWESTEEYRARMADDWKMFAAKLPLKSKPFKDAADVHVPSMLENTTRIVFRVFDEIFGNWSSIFNVLRTGPADTDAEVLTQFDNYQLTCLINDFYRQQMRAVLAFFTVGDVVVHSYYDGFREQNVHEVLTPDDFVAPYMSVTTRPDYSDLPYRVKIMNMYRHQLQAMRELWVDVSVVLKRERPQLDDDPETLWSDAMAEVHRIEKPADQRNAPYKILWYEGWTDLIPGQDRDRFIQAIVDYHTRTVLSLTIHEEPPYTERTRYEREVREHAQYSSARKDYETASAQWEAQRANLESQMGQPPPPPIADPMTGAPIPVMGPDEMLAQHEANKPQRPAPPTWMMPDEGDDLAEMDIYPDPEALANQPRPPRKEAIHTFTHSVCIEPMVGNLGIGFGRIQSDFNKALNIILSQTIDSATLANAWGLVVSGNLEFDKPFTHGPGAVNVAKGVSGTQLKDNLFPLQPGQANPQMFDVWDRIWGFAQSSAQAPEVLSGEPGKSGETFRGLNARIEQATKQLSVPARTFTKTCLEPVLKHNAKLNSMFLPEEHVCYVNDEFGMPQEIRVGRRMYERDYRVSFASTLRFAGRQQQIAEADEVVAMANMKGGPMTAGPLNPTGNLAFWHMALSKALKARGQADLIPLLGPKPPPPVMPFGMMPPQPMVQPGGPAGAAPGGPPAGPAAPPGAPQAPPPPSPSPQG